MDRGHASGYSVTKHRDRWTWTAFHNGNVQRGSSLNKMDAEWAARNAWDYFDRHPERARRVTTDG